MKRDIVLFDLDGTVLDTHDAILASMRHATRTVLDVEIPDEKLLSLVGQPLVTQMRFFAPDVDTASEMLVTYRTHNERNLNDAIKPFDGIGDVFVRLNAAGYTVGIVTSKRRSLAEESLVHFGLRDQLALVNGMEDSVAHKPDAEPLVKAAKDLGVSLDRCMYVGDSPYDLQAARAAGIPSIGVTWGRFFSRAALAVEHPANLVDSPDELYGAIKGLS